MTGSIAAAVVALRHPAVGGLEGLMTSPQLAGKLSLLPDFGDPGVFVPLFVVPLAVQWWAAWYPGAEPGGGGYIAQRMLAAKDEGHATGATLLFNAAHYALRPWPWILVALCSLVVFPDLESLRQAFPHVDPSVVRHDLAYPAMLTFLPAGLMGLVVGSLAAAYMSTISTHLNWGSSYVTHDFYRRFVKPGGDRTGAGPGRAVCPPWCSWSAAAGLALLLENALQAFQILLQIGAGTGLLFHPALVLVADQRLERAHRDGGLVRRRPRLLLSAPARGGSGGASGGLGSGPGSGRDPGGRTRVLAGALDRCRS